MWLTDIGPRCPECGGNIHGYAEATSPEARELRERIWRKDGRRIEAERGVIVAMCGTCWHGVTFPAPSRDVATLHVEQLKTVHAEVLASLVPA